MAKANKGGNESYGFKLLGKSYDAAIASSFVYQGTRGIPNFEEAKAFFVPCQNLVILESTLQFQLRRDDSWVTKSSL